MGGKYGPEMYKFTTLGFHSLHYKSVFDCRSEQFNLLVLHFFFLLLF